MIELSGQLHTGETNVMDEHLRERILASVTYADNAPDPGTNVHFFLRRAYPGLLIGGVTAAALLVFAVQRPFVNRNSAPAMPGLYPPTAQIERQSNRDDGAAAKSAAAPGNGYLPSAPQSMGGSGSAVTESRGSFAAKSAIAEPTAAQVAQPRESTAAPNGGVADDARNRDRNLAGSQHRSQFQSDSVDVATPEKGAGLRNISGPREIIASEKAAAKARAVQRASLKSQARRRHGSAPRAAAPPPAAGHVK